MKIVLICGDDTVASKNRYFEIKTKSAAKGFEIINAAAANLTFNSLFTDKILFCIDDAKKINLVQIEKITQDYKNSDINLLIWKSGSADAKLLKILGKETKVEKFDLPKIIFQLVENFYPGNAEKFKKLLTEFLKDENVEFLFTMLIRQIKELYLFHIDKKAFEKFPIWRANKIKSQAEKFDLQNIKDLIIEMADLDIKVKTSKVDLLIALDILIAKYLK